MNFASHRISIARTDAVTLGKCGTAVLLLLMVGRACGHGAHGHSASNGPVRLADQQRFKNLSYDPTDRQHMDLINDTGDSIKDVEVGCVGLGASGTELDSITHTFYDTFAPHSNTRVSFDLGPQDDQVVNETCTVTGYK
jgi:hypothetical protein